MGSLLRIPRPLGVLRKLSRPILKPDKVYWRSVAVFNPAAYVDEEGRVKLLYRAVGEYYRYVSRIGVAVSEDGVSFRYMGGKPLMYPVRGEEWWGVEDPRVSVVDGRLLATYVMWNKVTTRVGLAEVVDRGGSVKARRLGYVASPVDDKDAAVVEVDGKLLLVHRPLRWGGKPSIWVSEIDGCRGTVAASPRRSWVLYETPRGLVKSGLGPAPIRVDGGEWLMVFHVVYPPEVYVAYAALVDREFKRITACTPKPILVPSNKWELHGDVPFVVFPCGMVVRDDELIVYYGAGDKVVMAARGSLSELLHVLDRNRVDGA